MKARYQDITAKHAGQCARCNAPLQAGRKVFWDSQERRAYCDECAALISSGGLFGAPPQDATHTTPKG